MPTRVKRSLASYTTIFLGFLKTPACRKLFRYNWKNRTPFLLGIKRELSEEDIAVHLVTICDMPGTFRARHAATAQFSQRTFQDLLYTT